MTAEAKRTNSKSSWVNLGIGRLAVPAGRALLLLEPLGGFEVDAAEGAESILGEGLLDLLPLLVGEVSILVELGLESAGPP